MPPLTTENTSSLVGGGVMGTPMKAQQASTQPQTLKVRVLRRFQDHTRNVLAVGDVIELPRVFALEVMAANKAELIASEPEPEPVAVAAAPEPAAETEPTQDAKSSRRKKE